MQSFHSKGLLSHKYLFASGEYPNTPEITILSLPFSYSVCQPNLTEQQSYLLGGS